MSHKKRKSPEPTPEAKDEIPTDILAEWKQLFPDIDASELERAAEKARKRLEFKASIPGASHSRYGWSVRFSVSRAVEQQGQSIPCRTA